MRRLVTSPAVHFVLAGALLFLVVELRKGTGATPGNGVERARVVVPASQIALASEEIEVQVRRALTPAEEAQALQTAIDREVLFTYAVEIGLDRQPEIERRLAQIATFVADDQAAPPSGVEPTAWWAAEAQRLGLDRGDRVVRSLLIDRARRLIRAAVLAREPTEEALEDYLQRFPADFVKPARLAIDVVFLGRGTSEAAAQARLEGLQKGPVAGEGVESWPALDPRELERRLGAEALKVLPSLEVGRWQGPVPSRDGACLVRVRQQEPARPATLEEVREEVRAKARQQLADRWLEARLEQLREHYDVIIDPQKNRRVELTPDRQARERRPS